ncbi:Protein GVQW1 [Plecturocebus cupreus]
MDGNNQYQPFQKHTKRVSLLPRLECSGTMIAPCSLQLLGSETGSHFVAQSGLKLLASSSLPTQLPKVLGLQTRSLSSRLECSGMTMVHCSLDLLSSGYPPTSRQGLLILPRLVLNSWTQAMLLPQLPKSNLVVPRSREVTILMPNLIGIAHYSPELLDSRDPPASAFRVAGTTDTHHCARLFFFSFKARFHYIALAVASSKAEAILHRQPLEQLGLQEHPSPCFVFESCHMESHSVAQAGVRWRDLSSCNLCFLGSSDSHASAFQVAGKSCSVAKAEMQWCDLGSLQPLTPGLKQFSWHGFLIEIGFCHVTQAGLELLASSDLPASASQSAGITGVSCHIWLITLFGFQGLTGPGFWHLDYGSNIEKNIIMKSCYVDQAGLKLLASSIPPLSASQSAEIPGGFALSPRLEYSGTIKAHCSLDLRGASNPPTSTCQVAGTKGTHHYSQLTLKIFF